MPDTILYVGSRSGSFTLLAVATLMFAILGFVCYREMRKLTRAPISSMIVGILITVCPPTLIYTTSLDGYYELRFQADTVEARYLIPFFKDTRQVHAIRSMDGLHAFKLDWRMHVAFEDKSRWSSTTTSKRRVQSTLHAAERHRSVAAKPE